MSISRHYQAAFGAQTKTSSNAQGNLDEFARSWASDISTAAEKENFGGKWKAMKDKEEGWYTYSVPAHSKPHAEWEEVYPDTAKAVGRFREIPQHLNDEQVRQWAESNLPTSPNPQAQKLLDGSPLRQYGVAAAGFGGIGLGLGALNAVGAAQHGQLSRRHIPHVTAAGGLLGAGAGAGLMAFSRWNARRELAGHTEKVDSIRRDPRAYMADQFSKRDLYDLYSDPGLNAHEPLNRALWGVEGLVNAGDHNNYYVNDWTPAQAKKRVQEQRKAMQGLAQGQR
jgi:hypothetical protein